MIGVVVVGGALLVGCTHSARRSLPPATSSTTLGRTAATTTTTLPYVTYRVRPGDSLTQIASRYRVSPLLIASLNHLSNPDLLAEGQVLKIPPAPPLRLAVRPRMGTQGQAFQIVLTGAPPGGPITFEVHSPTSDFTGPQHVASADGTVNATYQTGANDAAGTYTVVAKGNTGPIGTTTFVVLASTPVT